MAKWIHHKETTDCYEHWSCSKCNHNIVENPRHINTLTTEILDFVFCPFCGARMEDTEGKEDMTKEEMIKRMKIPNNIKTKMHKTAKAFKKATDLMHELEDYFETQGIDIDELRSGNGISLEELEYGNDITDEFCEWLERELE